MRRIFAMIFLMAATPAFADATATCKFDKGVVTVAFTNAGPKAMQCEVNCNMAIKSGIGTVVCVKVVPPGSKDLVMCTESADGAPWTGIKAQEVNCRDPEGTPISPEEQKAREKADDEDSDALIKKMQQQSIEMLKEMQKMKQQQ
ncbi:MAG: hypothetical protein HY242_08050 [Afipia sp.]|nr:hypothetical protein [Afipia sp.]